MIVETSDNRVYYVWNISDQPDLDHVWWGVQVKRRKGHWVEKENARKELVRKAASRVVEA